MTTLVITGVDARLLREQYRTLVRIRQNNEILAVTDEGPLEALDGLIEFLEEILVQNPHSFLTSERRYQYVFSRETIPKLAFFRRVSRIN